MIRPPIPHLTSAVALALLAAASPVMADVYKVVAPDGHVTYSDQKPVNAQGQATVIGVAGAQRPLVAPASAPTGPPKMYLPAAPATEAPANRAIAGMGRSHGSTDAQLIEALVAIQAYEALVQGYLDTCGGMMPSSQPRFGAAARTWRQNNASMLKNSGELGVNLLSTAQLDAIRGAGQNRANAILAPVNAASNNPRIKWCDESTDALNGTLLNLDTKADIHRGLDRYVTR